MGAYRFVHAADIHLDSPLKSLALRDQDLAGLIDNATRRAFVRTVDLCLDEQVDALLLAGDLYDGEQTSMKTARFLAEQIKRLSEAGIRVYIIRGNHDALSKITRELVFPETVKVFGGRAEFVAVDRDPAHVPVAIHGLSFKEARVPESLLARYHPPVEGAVNIGLMHTSLGGSPGHDLYAPCSVAELHGTGFTYWALGHIHKRSVVEGQSAIVMPGMPQGRDIGEAGPKSVTLVTIGADRSVRLEERLTSVAEFERADVDATGLEDWRALVGRLGRVLEKARAAARSEHLILRLRITGATPLAWTIRRDFDLLKTEAAHRAAGIGKVWIDRVEIACRPPAAASGSASDPVSELARLIDQQVLASPAFRSDIGALAEKLMKQLPPELRDLLGQDEASVEAKLASVAAEGASDILARLQPGRAAEPG